MRLSDIKGEETFEVIADLLDPIADMGKKEAIKKADRRNRMGFVKVILKECRKEIIEILAILNKQDPEEYAKNLTLDVLFREVSDLMQDEVLMNLFGFQSQVELPKSGSATENTEGEKK